MYKISFYQNTQGGQPVKEYMEILQTTADSNKDSRIKLKKIYEYLEVLARVGTRAGVPYVKHIQDDLWELRPLRDRIFFFCWQGNNLILLHHFAKQTQRTPRREIEQARRNQKDFIVRSAQ
ncbi:MAG: type II toxin-antitoxin system RelE/ParE family toxin [Negativicutes bacterium]